MQISLQLSVTPVKLIRDGRPRFAAPTTGRALAGTVASRQSALMTKTITGFPDGIDESHATSVRGLRAHASLIAFLVLGGLVATALTGLLGGRPSPTMVVTAPAASLQVKLTRPLRSGLFFETHIVIQARRDIAKPVIGIDAALWRDLTINSHIPVAGDESFKEGQYRFEYGPLKAGETLDIKIDGQTNPPLVGSLAGRITFLDGDTQLTETQLSIPVFP
jgi:hypothetical protein